MPRGAAAPRRSTRALSTFASLRIAGADSGVRGIFRAITGRGFESAKARAMTLLLLLKPPVRRSQERDFGAGPSSQLVHWLATRWPSPLWLSSTADEPGFRA